MEQMEEKIGSILNNPQMMQQIMSMAQSLSASHPEPQPKPKSDPPSGPDIDIGAIQKLTSLAGQNQITREQQALLSALMPYLSRDRVQKLEKAMRAEKMARLASSFINQGGLSLLTGR